MGPLRAHFKLSRFALGMQVPGTMEAFAVDGTPADSVKLALHSNLLGGGEPELGARLSHPVAVKER